MAAGLGSVLGPCGNRCLLDAGVRVLNLFRATDPMQRAHSCIMFGFTKVMRGRIRDRLRACLFPGKGLADARWLVHIFPLSRQLQPSAHLLPEMSTTSSPKVPQDDGAASMLGYCHLVSLRVAC